MLRTHRTNGVDDRSSGFTIVEVTIVLLLVGLLFPLFSFILNMYHDAYYLDDRIKMSNEVSHALWYMEDSVRLAGDFMATVPNTFVDAYGPHNAGTAGAEAWSYKGDSATSRVLITQNYSTTVNALNTGRQPVFRNTGTFNCTTEMYYQPQLTYISVYFVRNNTLYHRVLTDRTSPLCPGNSQQQKQSCPPYITSGRHASCETNDEILATNVSNFTVAYYRITQNNTSVQLDPSYTSNNPLVLATADYAEVTLTESARNGAITTTLKQRMTRINE